MRLRYSKYTLNRGVEKIKTKTGLAVMALALALGGSGGLTFVALENASAATTNWSLNGSYTLDFELSGSHYVHDATISGQDSLGNFNINGGYPAGSAPNYQDAWAGTGNISGNAVTMDVSYNVGAPGTNMHMTGTVAADGTLSGSWSDNYQGTRTGTWSTASGSASMTSNVTVTTANPQGWAFFDDNGNGGSGSFVPGPGNPPLGIGSAQLGVTAANQGYALGGTVIGGLPVKLANLSTATYSTYVQQGDNTIAPALQFNVDKDVTDSDTSFQGRLVYEPYLNGSVVDGQWQTWNAISGKWWLSHSSAQFSNNCGQASPCTFSQLIALYPNIGVKAGPFNTVFKAGSGWNVPFVGNVDAFSVGTANVTTTYNFEPYVVPTDKDQCKDGGWQNLKAADGSSFKNQGLCVSYVASNGKSQH